MRNQPNKTVGLQSSANQLVIRATARQGRAAPVRVHEPHLTKETGTPKI